MIRLRLRDLNVSVSNVPALICLSVLFFAEASFGAVRFDVVGSPTEVINTGGSEVLGSVNLIVRGTGNTTGTAQGGAVQIGLIFNNPAIQIDNTAATGITLFSSAGFAVANPTIIELTNQVVNGRCSGFLTINLAPGATPADGDFIRIEGIRGRIDASQAITPGSDLFVDLQSVNDPSANNFTPDRIRIAKSLKGLVVDVLSTSVNYEIRISEGFARAFVDSDANNDGINFNDRTNSPGAALGAPTNSTQFLVRLDGIPSGIADVQWPAKSTVASTGAALYLLGSTFSASTSTATYSFEAIDQTGSSDTVIESFSLTPAFVFGSGKCNLDELVTTVSLAPSHSPASACAGPAPDSARPRFLQLFELTLATVAPTSAVVHSPGFNLTVRGTGLVSASTVLWNGTPLPTTFVSSTQLAAAVPASNLVKVGTANISVANPQSIGGAISNSVVLTITPPALSLFFPRLVSTSDPQVENTEFTAIALTNTSPRDATLRITAFDKSGAKITGDNITNPATLILKPEQQLPVIDAEIFGSGFRNANRVGWMKVEGDVPEVIGFFLSFNGTLTRLDGTGVSSDRYSSFIFSEIETQGFSQIHIANPNDDPTTVNFELVNADGTSEATASRSVNGNGVIAESAADIFPGVTLDNSDYIRVVSNHEVVPFEYLGKTKRDTAGIVGQETTAGASNLFIPQYVVGGSDWESIVSIVNLSSVSGDVSLRFIQDDGTQIGATQVVPIAARGKLRITNQEFFVGAGNVLKYGFVEVRANSGIKLGGSIVFNNPAANAFSAVLPLISSLQNSLAFGQVASNDTFFTGLCLLNPGDADARTIIKVFDGNGNAVAGKMEDIPAHTRKSQLLTEFFPSLIGQDIGNGYVIVTSNGNLTGFVAFGTKNLSVLTTVPALRIPGRP